MRGDSTTSRGGTGEAREPGGWGKEGRVSTTTAGTCVAEASQLVVLLWTAQGAEPLLPGPCAGGRGSGLRGAGRCSISSGAEEGAATPAECRCASLFNSGVDICA